MAEINISSIVSYYNSGTNTDSGVSGVTGYTTSAGAKSAAKTAAQNAANSTGGGTPSTGGKSSSIDLIFGSNLGGVSSIIGTPGAAINPDDGDFDGWCSWSAERTSTMYQLKLKFTIPSGLTAANIKSATISFTAKASHTTNTEYRICAPKSTSEQTNYQKYSDTTIIDTSKYVSFNTPENTSAKSYSLTFTDVFKQCITKGQGWVTILLPRNAPEGNRLMTLSGTPQITYTENYSACGAPTSVSCGTAIQKPGATVSITWSGATAGTGNPITGYTVYWKLGGAPTTSSYTSYANVSTTSYSFSIPSGDTNRGKTYYFKVLTKGTVSGYNSGISSAQATTKVNSLPSVPTINVDKTKIKSTATSSSPDTIKFTTITSGTDNDTSQTKTVRYIAITDSSTPPTPTTSNTTAITSGKTFSIYQNTSYYFWTYDGLEFSSSYTLKTITKNTPPSIGSVTMSAVATYSPSKSGRSYVKNIKGSATNVTGNNLTYQWQLCYASGTDTTLQNLTTVKNISTAVSFTNIDVTSYGVTFNTAYKLRLTVTDDAGESATKEDSNHIFIIPSAPTITIINRKDNTNKGGNTNDSHFDDGLRIKYSENNTGTTKVLEYSTVSNFSSNVKSINISTTTASGVTYTDITPDFLERGTTYYFRVKYTCNTKTAIATRSGGLMRAKDITPTNLAITPSSGTVIKPYTQSTLGFSFSGQPTTWATEQDVSTSYSEIYTIKLKYSSRSHTATINNCSNNTGSVSGSIVLSSITTEDWKTLLGFSNAPNNSYNITFEVTATNGFGTDFIASKTISVNFVEGIYSIGTVKLQIKTKDSSDNISYTDIPSRNNKTGLERYHIFEGQTLKFCLSNLQCYANQAATVYVMDDDQQIKTASITASQWNAPTGTSRLYTLNSDVEIEYVVPANTTGDVSSGDKNYSIKVTLANTKSSQSYGTNLKSCFHMKFSPDSINFKITKAVDATNNATTIYWSCSDWGGLNSTSSSNERKSIGYSKIEACLYYGTTPNGNYTAVSGGYVTLKADSSATPSASGYFSRNLSNISGDILYLGSRVQVTLDYVAIGNNTPINSKNSGNIIYTLSVKKAQFTYYRLVPNLLYGKNFFCLNQSTPVAGRTDQILEISAAENRSISPVGTRDKIYFGTDGTVFQITNNGLVIDCGSWN